MGCRKSTIVSIVTLKAKRFDFIQLLFSKFYCQILSTAIESFVSFSQICSLLSVFSAFLISFASLISRCIRDDFTAIRPLSGSSSVLLDSVSVNLVLTPKLDGFRVKRCCINFLDFTGT